MLFHLPPAIFEHKSWMKLVKQDARMPHDTAEVQLLQVFWWLLLLGLLLEAWNHCINPSLLHHSRQWLASGGLASLWDSPLGHQGTIKTWIPKWFWGQVGEKPYTSVKGNHRDHTSIANRHHNRLWILLLVVQVLFVYRCHWLVPYNDVGWSSTRPHGR